MLKGSGLMVQAGLVGVSYLDQYIELYLFLGIVSSGKFPIILNHLSVCNSGLFILITSKFLTLNSRKVRLQSTGRDLVFFT